MFWPPGHVKVLGGGLTVREPLTEPFLPDVNVPCTVTAQGTFTSGKNGSVRGSLTVSPPPSTLTCPGGQNIVLVSVDYTNVSLSSSAGGTCDTSPGTFGANFFPQC